MDIPYAGKMSVVTVTYLRPLWPIALLIASAHRSRTAFVESFTSYRGMTDTFTTRKKCTHESVIVL
jgi:hypothetical protein